MVAVYSGREWLALGTEWQGVTVLPVFALPGCQCSISFPCFYYTYVFLTLQYICNVIYVIHLIIRLDLHIIDVVY